MKGGPGAGGGGAWGWEGARGWRKGGKDGGWLETGGGEGAQTGVAAAGKVMTEQN